MVIVLKNLGVGRWVQIVDSGALPGKQIQQLNGQTQRLLGKQSLAEYTGLQLDVLAKQANDKLGRGEDAVAKKWIDYEPRREDGEGTVEGEERGKRATVRFNSRTNRSNRDSETSSRRRFRGRSDMGKTTTKAA